MDFQLFLFIAFILISVYSQFSKKRKSKPTDDDPYGVDPNDASEVNPDGRPLTWEEMEKQYGIKIQRKEDDAQLDMSGQQTKPADMTKTAQETEYNSETIKDINKKDEVNTDSKLEKEENIVISEQQKRYLDALKTTKEKKTTVKNIDHKTLKEEKVTGLQRAARNGVIWAELMQKPLALRKRR